MLTHWLAFTTTFCLLSAAQAATPSQAEEEAQPRGDHRRADAVLSRHQGRQLLSLGRTARDPLPILSAAQLFRQSPPPRPLVREGEGVEDSAAGTAQEGEQGTVQDVPSQKELFAEARSLARTRKGPLLATTLALIDRVEKSEVTSRGATLGPQQLCERIGPWMKITYNVRYEAEQQAVVAVAGDGPGALQVTVLDELQRPIGTTPDRALVTFFPRRRAVYQVILENRTDQPIPFCIETN